MAPEAPEAGRNRSTGPDGRSWLTRSSRVPNWHLLLMWAAIGGCWTLDLPTATAAALGVLP